MTVSTVARIAAENVFNVFHRGPAPAVSAQGLTLAHPMSHHTQQRPAENAGRHDK